MLCFDCATTTPTTGAITATASAFDMLCSDCATNNPTTTSSSLLVL